LDVVKRKGRSRWIILGGIWGRIGNFGEENEEGVIGKTGCAEQR
jgi:hypothetical protein